MSPDHVLDIATAPRYNSRHWRQETITWGEILTWVDEPADVKECGNYVLGRIIETTVDHTNKKRCTGIHRRKGAIGSRSGVTLDVDQPGHGLPEKLEMVLPYAALVHTTWRSAPDSPRYRILMPADRDMTPEEYFAVTDVLMEKLGRAQFDPGSVQPERYMFRPAAQERGWFKSWVIDGDPICVDDLLKEFDPDLTRLPAPKPHPHKRNPFELEGVVGAFNRAYTIEEVIREYELPYIAAGESRWQLVGTKTEAGMGLIADGLVYSHHVTDPAAGQTCSAFDLVRLHRFSELDEETTDKTPINRRPSHEAMLELASKDARVIAELVGVDFDQAMDDTIEDSDDWKLGLRFNPRTGKFVDCIENWDLVRNNEPPFQALYFNELTLSVEVDRDLPWRSLDRGGAIFSGTDRAALYHYLEREYRIRPPRTLIDELVDTTAHQRFVNPIQDYLNSLAWDGTPRVEECLPGVRPTPYTRMVARKSLVAAVARILNPGVKWDHTLVLFGPEGKGKSWWIDKLSRGYSATLGRIGDKDTLITMQRSWIMIADEGYSLRKADADATKEFLTRTEDIFRMPYERESLVHKRHCVIWGTTNDEVFLRRQEGNRRFLIVRCEENVDFDALTDEYIDQVWAEAVHLYRNGERLFLEESEGAVAAGEREQFTEEDALAGVIQEYLDTLVPEDWDEMSPDGRRLWLQNRADGLVPKGTERITRTCSAQLWVEALGRRFGDHKRTDLLEINAALKRLPGWEALPGRHRITHYGPQLVFARTEDLI